MAGYGLGFVHRVRCVGSDCRGGNLGSAKGRLDFSSFGGSPGSDENRQRNMRPLGSGSASLFPTAQVSVGEVRELILRKIGTV